MHQRSHRIATWLLCWSVLCLPGCVTLPKQPASAIAPSAAPTGVAPVSVPPPSKLSRAFGPMAEKNQPASGFRMISGGMDGLLTRVELIDSAEHSLDLQYYIFRSDDSGRLIQKALLRAADRGVHVRIIGDDGETIRGDEKMLLLAAHPQIEVRIFNPFSYRGHNKALRSLDFLLHKSRLDYRMHNKLMVVDGTLAVTGGRNVGDQYFQIDPNSQFGDDDVVAVGPIVERLKAEFAEYWLSPQVVGADRLVLKKLTPEVLKAYRDNLGAPIRKTNTYTTDFDKRIGSGEPLHSLMTGESNLSWAPATLLYDAPDKKQARDGSRFGRLMYGPVADRIAATRSELIMITPYFVPVPAEIQLLEQERDRNVRVRLLTNSLMSAPDLVAHAGYMHYRPALLENGVHLYEIRADLGSTRGSGESRKLTRYGNFALHAKLFVFDRTSLFVGSMNLDQRSVRLNTEMGLIIDSNQLANDVATRFNALTTPENSYEIALRSTSTHDKPALTWKTQENGKPVEYLKEPSRNFRQKLEVHLLSLLPLDQEL